MAVFRRSLSLLGTVAVLAVLAAGCSRTEVRSGRGFPCSISDDDDPYFICDPTLDLICINTTTDSVYYCRVPCEVGKPGCDFGETCCPGKVHGDDLGATHGCTPRAACDAVRE